MFSPERDRTKIHVVEPNAADLDTVDIECQCGNKSDLPFDCLFALHDMHCGQCGNKGTFKVTDH